MGKDLVEFLSDFDHNFSFGGTVDGGDGGENGEEDENFVKHH